MLAYVHYVLVNPKYQGLGIAGHLIEHVKEKYKDYLIPEDKSNVAIYFKCCFQAFEGVGSIIVCNLGKREWFKAPYLLESMGYFDI